MALGSIVVRLTMNTADFETDTARAAKIAEKRASELDAIFKKAGIAIGLALSAAVVGVTKAVKDSVDHMDELSKAAQRVGLPTEDFSQLAYAGSLADVSMEDLQGSLGKLVKGMGDAQRDTSIQSKLFKALGIDVLDASGKMRSAKDVLYDFADAFKRQEGSPEIIAAGMNIFGRSFQKIIPLIKDGSSGLREMAAESDALGKTLSTQAGQQAEAFNDNITRLQSALGGLAQNVAADLLPDLVDLTNQFVGLVKEGHGAGTLAHDIADGFRIMGSAAESSITLVSGVATVVGGLTQQLAGFYEMAAALGNFDWERRAKGAAMYKAGGAQIDIGADRLVNPHGANGLFNGADTTNYNFMDGGGRPATAAAYAVGSYSGALLAPSKALADALKEQAEAAQAIRGALGDPDKPAKGMTDAEKAAKKLNDQYDSLLASQRQQIALFGDTSAAARVRYDTEFGALAGLTQAKKDALIADAKWLDTLREDAELYKKSITDLPPLVEKAASEMSVFAEEAGRNMQDAFADFLFDPFKDGVDGMLEGFANILRRMAAEMAASKVFEAIGAWGKANGGSGGWQGALASFVAGFGGQRAGGGGVDGSKLYEVGEGGRPELFQQNGRTYLIPGNDGHVSPAANSSFGAPPAGIGGGLSIEVNNYGNDRVNARMQPDTDGMKKIVIDIVAEDMASGGKTARSAKQRFNLRETV